MLYTESEKETLCGKRTLELWNFKLDGRRKVLEIESDGSHKEFRMIDTLGNHYGIVLETRDKLRVPSSSNQDKDDESGVLFLDNEEEELCSFKSVKKVHEINRHKKKEQLIAAYRNAGWMSPGLVGTITQVVND